MLTLIHVVAVFDPRQALSCGGVTRRLKRQDSPLSEPVGGLTAILRKVRKREPMAAEELDYARQVIADRRSPLAFCIPFVIIGVGCIYVFGSLEQLHGRDPSIRTFIGLIPMLAGTNLTMQLLRIAKLKRRLPKAAADLTPA
ncbi:MAG: hypothetical protein H6522_02940 [Mycolicibacterium sp.]|nr:hypothetical protein [Mycolicibacterium sp.]